jgi:3-oxoacyl-[acyl-carrier protein] reductase
VSTPGAARPIDRVAIVTGGSRGIGRAVAHQLARRHYAVVVDYAHDQRAGDRAVDEVLAAGGTALAVRADVADELDVERLFAESTEAFGGVDVVVHAAGLVAVESVADHDLDLFDALQRTNVRGTFVVARQAARRLRPGGAIVNLSCAAAQLAPPGYAAAAASKAAVEALTRVLAGELAGRDITVNAVAPRLDDPGSSTAAAVADVVTFLVSEAGRCLTGQVIRVDGPWPRTTRRWSTD